MCCSCGCCGQRRSAATLGTSSTRQATPGDPVGDYNDSHDIIATLPDEPEAAGMELAH